MLYQHEKLSLFCYLQNLPRSLHYIAFALHSPLHFHILWMVCEYIQSTHGIALAINVVRLWRTLRRRWFWRPGRLGVPPVMSLVGRFVEADALCFPLLFETCFRPTWRYCNALSVAWPNIWCCEPCIWDVETLITCRVMLRGTLIMGTRKRSIIGGVPGIYSRHRHRLGIRAHLDPRSP